MSDVKPCPICGAIAGRIGAKRGTFIPNEFIFCQCGACGFCFVANPHPNQAEIYSEEYFAGRGADPFVDYLYELEHPDSTIRVYEWRGILRSIQSLTSVNTSTRWLDFSCGNGGLVRYCREATGCNIVGHEEGSIAEKASRAGIPLINRAELAASEGSFDIVTAIEVLEHVPEPLAALQQIRTLLRPNGLFFCTTGNVEPHRSRILRWRYAYPEVHISLFEPRTLALALEKSGFEPQWPGYLPGFTDIIRFKALKTVGVRHRSRWERILPWPALSHAIDKRLRITAHPVGIACGSLTDLKK